LDGNLEHWGSSKFPLGCFFFQNCFWNVENFWSSVKHLPEAKQNVTGDLSNANMNEDLLNKECHDSKVSSLSCLMCSAVHKLSGNSVKLQVHDINLYTAFNQLKMQIQGSEDVISSSGPALS
jgi:hypothetical protein